MSEQSPSTDSTFGQGYAQPVSGPVGQPTGGPYGQYWPAQYVVQPERKPVLNGLAVASMVLGIIWLYWLGSLLAVIFGHVALKQTRDGSQTGRGFAIAGVALGWTGMGTFVFVMLIGLLSSFS